MKKGLLIINTGSPESFRESAVRTYLREFLSDYRIMDLPWPARQLILNLFILPFRPARSAALYKSIWTEDGSPLTVHTKQITRKIGEELSADENSDFSMVRMAMRYGNPSINDALDEMHRAGIRHIRILPLFAQNASATTSSILARIYSKAARYWSVPEITVVGAFFEHPLYIQSLGDMLLEARKDFEKSRNIGADHVLFTYHGLPERHIQKSDSSGVCRMDGECCVSITDRNRGCYRAQSFRTASLAAEYAGLSKDQFSVSFQSRMGSLPWIGPHTDDILADLPSRGVKRLLVMAPSFLTDCLETLEEIEIRGKKLFLEAGGEEFVYVPALNDDSRWIRSLVEIIRKA